MNTDQAPQFPKNHIINYDLIMSRSDFLPTTRLLACQLKEQQYLLVGDFFKNLSTEEIEDLDGLIQQLTPRQPDQQNPAAIELVLLTSMLIKAEACYCESYADLHRYLQKFITFTISAGLERKGLVVVHWENASFGDEYDDRHLVTPIPSN